MPRFIVSLFKLLALIIVVVAAAMSFRTWDMMAVQRMADRAEAGQVLTHPAKGRPAVRVVMLTRYGCDPCRAAHESLRAALEQAPDVRVVVLPMASNAPWDRQLSRLVLAAGLQDRFAAYHSALMESDRPLTEEHARATALDLGLDFDRMMLDSVGPEIDGALAVGPALAADLRLSVNVELPVFVINRKIVYIPGSVSPVPEDFLAVFDEARHGFRKQSK